MEGHRLDVHAATGVSVREVFDRDLPAGQLLIRCNDRRATRCAACADVYREDAFHLVTAGLPNPRCPGCRDRLDHGLGAWGSGSDARSVHARDRDHAPQGRPASRRRALGAAPGGLKLYAERSERGGLPFPLREEVIEQREKGRDDTFFLLR